MRGKITKKSVDAVKPTRAEDVLMWDRELRGFGLRVKPSGKKSFVVSYYAPGLHRTRRRLTLGAYGPLTADDARAAATAILADVAKGNDPASARTEDRRAAKDETVERLFADYLDYGRAHFKPKTVKGFESMARLHLLPALGKRPVAKVSTRDVARLHLALKASPGIANRVVQMVKAFFYWLERGGLFTGTNPARHVTLYPEHPCERFLTVAEAQRVEQALHVAETVGLPPAPEHRPAPTPQAKAPKRARNAGMFKSELQPANPIAVAALRFLVLTGWREQEAMQLQWSEVDLTTGNATLGDTKTGKSNRSITAPALEVLAAQARVEGWPYVFPGRDPQKPLESVHRLWTAVRSAAQLEDVRLHDLRHSVASFAVARGYSLYMVGKLLGHKTARSTERYAHLADDARKVMADDVGEFMRQAMATAPDIKSTASTTKVLPMVRKTRKG